MDILVDIEASIDYPEYDVEEVTNDKALNTLLEVEEKIKNLEKSFENGKIIEEGINIAIIGKPNSGKSSLLNAILNTDRAIVTDIEGTTRDTIEEMIQIDGIPVKIIDTAGIRKTEDTIEKIGIDKSIDVANNSDLTIAIIDGSKKLEKEDIEILDIIKDKKAIILLNKIDKKSIINEKEIKEIAKNKAIIPISALEKIGIKKIYEKISEMYKFDEISVDDSLSIANERHKQLIINIKENIIKAKKSIEEKMPIDVVTIYIMNILEEIGKITGEGVSEDVISEIFKKFCLGK